MANPEHISLLTRSVADWNQWRIHNTDIQPDLVEADLSKVNLREANLRGADLSMADLHKADLRGTILHWANLDGATLRVAKLYGADLRGATLKKANLNGADLRNASLYEANLRGASLSHASLSHASLYAADLSTADLSTADLSAADLSRATLSKVNLRDATLDGANLSEADLTGADLSGASLERATLVSTICNKAIFTGSRIHGISAWNLQLEEAQQTNLIITRSEEPAISVDNLEVGQFIYLMLNNTKIRDVINSITSKSVLILGRFSDPKRKAVLDGLRVKLREFDLSPIVFDFDRPTDKDYTETVQTLAGMSMFIIVDLTNAKSTPLELEATVKQFKIPYVPIIDVSVEDPNPFAMFGDLQKSFHWVLGVLEYESPEDLLDHKTLKTYVIDPVNAKREELRKYKNQEVQTIQIPRKKDSSSLS
jgi:uncharacterized protein YjbI with pentapeptide repeats